MSLRALALLLLALKLQPYYDCSQSVYKLWRWIAGLVAV